MAQLLFDLFNTLFKSEFWLVFSSFYGPRYYLFY